MVPFGATGIRAGGAFLTGVSEGPWLSALAAPAHTAASSAADLPVIRNTRGCLGGTVTVVTDVAGVALTLPTVALPVTWAREEDRGGSQHRSCCETVTLATNYCLGSWFIMHGLVCIKMNSVIKHKNKASLLRRNKSKMHYSCRQ